MPLDPELAALLCHTIYIAPEIAISAMGDYIHGAAKPYAARVDPASVLVGTRPTGEDDISEYAIITEAVVGKKDLIWYPGQNPQDTGQGRLPKRIEPFYEADGTLSHYEVLI